MTFWRKVITITWKDILTEIRTREIIVSVLVFALLALVIFSFAFGSGEESTKLVAPAILWVTFAFAGVLSLNRSFILEKEEGCIEGLMVCPVSREAIYIGKMLGSLLFMLIIEAIALLAFAVFFNLLILSLKLVVIIVLATFGFVSVGTLFAALSVNTRAREMVLPILFLPMVVPVIISAVKASGLALSGKDWSALSSWLQIISAFDVIFFVVSFLIFTYVIEE